MDSGSQGERDNVADPPDGVNFEEDNAGSETVQIMRLKLALARLEMQRERERDERARDVRERELEIERERAGMRDGSRGPNQPVLLNRKCKLFYLGCRTTPT